MRVIALLILLCVSSEFARAQTTGQCQSMQRAGDHLDCYNGIAPSPTVGKPKASKLSSAPVRPASLEPPIAVDKRAAPKTPTDQKGRYVDELAAENSKLDAKMKTICRGC